jgi:hypothetical protein
VQAEGPAVCSEWPWAFHAGKSYAFETARGTGLYLSHQTVFGHLVVAVENDRDGLVDRIARSIPVEDVTRLSRRAEAARGVAEKLDALFALAGAQGLSGGVSLPAFEEAVRRALDDESPVVRLAAIRATAILPVASGLALLEGRDDPENPGLAEWRDHYRGASS